MQTAARQVRRDDRIPPQQRSVPRLAADREDRLAAATADSEAADRESLRLGSAPAVIYAVGLTLLAFLFIAPLRIPKPGLKGILCMVLFGVIELYLMLYGVMPL